MRGDRPWCFAFCHLKQRFTPHARGSTAYPYFTNLGYSVYPACAGIDHRCLCRVSRHQGLPRMRGDRPGVPGIFPARRKFTPHARGSTRRGEITVLWTIVYPACAGIDPHRGSSPGPLRLPRMRGDRPSCVLPDTKIPQFTPHARGSTLSGIKIYPRNFVYPACAGIDLPLPGIFEYAGSLPRMRGDRPFALSSAARLSSLPRMRGDRPTTRKWLRYLRAFTPHARGSTT